MAVVDQQLGGDMALLGELRLFERRSGMFEIGAGILAVGIEEQIVKPDVEIVMMGDVLLGVQPIVALAEPARRDARVLEYFQPARAAESDDVPLAERQHVVKVAFGDDEAPVHIEFAKRKSRIERQFPLGGAIGELDAELRPGSVAENLDDPVGGLDLEMAVLDELGQEGPKKRSH